MNKVIHPNKIRKNDIEKKVLVPDRLSIPTIEGLPGDKLTTYSYSISSLKYSNSELAKVLTENFALQDAYYFVVKRNCLSCTVS